MAKIFSFNKAYNGSYIDSVSGEAGINTNGIFKKTEQGISYLVEGNADLTYPNSDNLNFGDSTFTIVAAIKTNKGGNYSTIINKGTGNKFTFGISNNNPGRLIAYTQGTSGNSGFQSGLGGVTDNKWHLVEIKITPTSFTFYIDSVLDLERTFSSVGNIDNTDVLTIANGGTLGRFDGYISNVKIYNGTLTQQERNKLYKDFLRPKATGESICKNDFPIKAIDKSRFKDDGLVADYNMIPSSGGVLTDISGNGNNGTINGAISTKNGMSFNSSSKIDLTSALNLGTEHAISFRFNPKILATEILLGEQSGTNNFFSLNSVGQFTYRSNAVSVQSSAILSSNCECTLSIVRNSTSVYLYVNGVLADTLTVSDSNPLTGINQLFARSGALSFEGDCNDLKIYNRAQTLKEIKDYHNRFVKPVIISDYKYDGVGNFPKEYQKGTGEYSVQESDGTDGLDVDTKYLQCDTSGTISIQSDVAYGEWEFDFYTAFNPRVYFISEGKEGTNSYRVDYSGGFLRFFGSSLLFNTSATYADANTWYRIKITRTTDGEFTFYIKGGSFGDAYQLVDVTGGSGSNPVIDTTYKKSKFFVADLDVGDYITNIKIQNGIKQ